MVMHPGEAADASVSTQTGTGISRRHPLRSIAITVIAIGLILRLVAALWYPPDKLIGDEIYYWDHATIVLESGDPGDSFHPPGQPYLIALSRILFGQSEQSARILNLIAYLVAVWAVLRLAGSWRNSLLPVSMLALHPVLIGYAGFLWNESNFIAVFLGAFVMQFGSAPSKKRMAAAGLLWGVASLIRQIGFGFALISLFAQWGWDRRSISMGRVSVFLLGLIIAMAPWVIRNYDHHGRLVLVSSDTMFQLWAGNNDEVFEPYTTDPTPFEKLREHYSTFGRNDREREIVAYHRAVDFIRIEQPQWLFRKARAGLRRLFVPDNFVLRHMRHGSYGGLSAGWRKSLYAVTVLGEALIIVLGIVMLVRARPGPRTAAVLLMVLYALAVHLFTVAVSRHRLVIELVPLGLAGVAWRPWSRRSAALAALCVAVVLLSALI